MKEPEAVPQPPWRDGANEQTAEDVETLGARDLDFGSIRLDIIGRSQELKPPGCIPPELHTEAER